MTQVRWLLACAVTLGLGGLAAAQECPAAASAPRTSTTQSACPACCQDCPVAASTGTTGRSVWQFVLRLGGVNVGVAAQTKPAAHGAAPCATCPACTQNAECGACTNSGIYDIVGQCAPVSAGQTTATRTGSCEACCGACATATAVTQSCPCPHGTSQADCASGTAVSRFVIGATPTCVSVPAQRIIAERVTTAVTRPTTTVKITASGGRVQIQTPAMQAVCNSISSQPNGEIVLEGNVQIRCTDSNAQARIEARRIVVNFDTNEFKIPQGNGPSTASAYRVGLIYTPSPIPMFFPPAPPVPTIAYPMPIPHPVPTATPVSRPVTPTGYYQLMPNPSR